MTVGEMDGSMVPNEILPILGPANEQGGFTVILYVLVELLRGLSLSVSLTSKVKVPDKVGVPDISAVSDGDGTGIKNRPGGRLPAVIDQKYGVTPLEAVNVVE